MAFRYESRNSGTINAQDIMGKSNEENFENLIKQYKELSQEDLINAGTNAFIVLANTIAELWPDNYTQALFAVIVHAVGISCAGMTEMPETKKDAIAKFFLPLGEETATALRNDDNFFHPENYGDEEYNLMIDIFLSPCKEPLLSDYPFRYYQFIMACTVADEINEHGFDKLRSLRKDYMEYCSKNNS